MSTHPYLSELCQTLPGQLPFFTLDGLRSTVCEQLSTVFDENQVAQQHRGNTLMRGVELFARVFRGGLMKSGRFDFRFMKLQITLLAVTVLGLGAISWAVWASFYQVHYVGVGLTGVHHLGSGFKIDEFNVDGTDGGNVGWEGGGGRGTCCVDLPKKWTPGLMVTVRWAISDWSKVNRAETAAGNYDSVTSGGMYRARVPVEKYDVPEQLYVHFFSNGRARVVSSSFDTGIHHPIAEDDPTAALLATKGVLVSQLFTDEEIAEIHRKAALRKKWHGEWL